MWTASPAPVQAYSYFIATHPRLAEPHQYFFAPFYRVLVEAAMGRRRFFAKLSAEGLESIF
jgi:hypothetical protein